jgi:hypothetical protein
LNTITVTEECTHFSLRKSSPFEKYILKSVYIFVKHNFGIFHTEITQFACALSVTMYGCACACFSGVWML